MKTLLILMMATLLLPACTELRPDGIKPTPATEGCARGNIQPDGRCTQIIR